MRIIAGTARGRRIFSVSKNLPVKPISDRIKQSLFD
ncbi:MAG TPA: 16S rRNA (guanine(966)-N(2))-methyltransferase RsmD, partial [Elusimicrobia bacterium]|nr:16S rRNA (guanine(966)-N(2))-methyltransferase RsmD [Elusimicrobiota bacterium]